MLDLPLQKHLPEQHNQKTHGRKGADHVEAKPTNTIDPNEFSRQLHDIANLWKQNSGKESGESFAETFGNLYQQTEFTEEEKAELLEVFSGQKIKQTAGECYNNAWSLHLAGDMDYVEGFGDSLGWLPMGHAWVEYHGKPVDVTWSTDIADRNRPRTPKALLARVISNAKHNVYRGYKVPDKYVFEKQSRTGVYGPILDDRDNSYAILRSGTLPWLKELKHLAVQDGEHVPNQKSALNVYLQDSATADDTLRLAAKGWQPAIDAVQTMGDFLDDMDSAVRKNSLKEETTAYKAFSDIDWYGLDIGDVIEDPSYMSVMLSRIEKSGVTAEIRLPVDQSFVVGNADELILPRHTKLKVVNKSEFRLTMEVVP